MQASLSSRQSSISDFFKPLSRFYRKRPHENSSVDSDSDAASDTMKPQTSRVLQRELLSDDSDGDSEGKTSDEQEIPSTSLKVYRLAVFQHCLPCQFSQACIDGRNGSSACHLIACLLAARVLDQSMLSGLDAALRMPLVQPQELA